jgi:4-hydroxybenzoate polyprenyltransferase
MQAGNKYVSRAIQFVNQYLGWRNWSVIVYNSVIENIFLVFYICLRDELFSANFLIDLLVFLGFSVFSTSYGYLINDLADKELDALHGKENTFRDDSSGRASSIVFAVLALSIVLGIRFRENRGFLPLWLCWGFLATFYSIKPIRLKEKGKLGLISVVIAQRVLPILIVFAAFKHYEWIDVVTITVYILFRGLSSDLNHQLEDYQRDVGTGTNTYSVRTGITKARKIFRFCLEIEKALLIACLLVMHMHLGDLRILRIPVLLPVLGGYIFLYAFSWVQIWSQGSGSDLNPFLPGRKDIFQFMHHAFPSVVLPFYLLLLLIYQRWWFIVVLLLFAMYRRMYSLEVIRESFPVRLILDLKRQQRGIVG